MKCIGKEGIGHVQMESGKESVNTTVITRYELLQHYYHNKQHKTAEKTNQSHDL